jgi:hypothetical protein
VSIPTGVSVIHITSPTEVCEKLAPLPLRDRPEVKCTRSEVLKGLSFAQKTGRRLAIDESADPIPNLERTHGGIVVVEDDDVCSVVAVNYASSVGANLLVVPKIAKRELKAIHKSLQAWKINGADAHLDVVKEAVTSRTGGMSFQGFEYGTFFTSGLPYSLVIENVIPCTYVHLIRPDLFIFNGIAFERIKTLHSAVVFSPLFFPDEETSWLTQFFIDKDYYVRQLVGRDASFANLDFTIQHLPYSLLHICSHGGEVDGWEVSEEFVDRHGERHVIEYDEVVGCDLNVDKDGKVQVHRKAIFRKLDGFDWMSEELEKQNIPQYVFLDMWKALYEDQRNRLNPRAKRKKMGQVATSCAIRCSDTIHQGALQVLASHSSPLVFNNTCWSWYEVASFFLSCGSRGYIGTLWAIDNEAAILGARTFYENVFSDTVLGACYKAVKAIAHAQSKDIYVFWGLHFTTLSRARDAQESRAEVCAELVRAFAGWKAHIQSTKSREGRRNTIRIIESIVRELQNNFSSEDLAKLHLQKWSRTTRALRGRKDCEIGEEVPIPARRSLDY